MRTDFTQPNKSFIARLRPGREGHLIGEDLGGGMVLVSEEQAQTLAQDPAVLYLVPNDRFKRSANLDSPLPPTRQWGLNNTGQDGGTPDADIDAPEAWEKTGKGKGIVVAVLDTGTDMNHPDLAPNRWVNPNEIRDGKDNDGNGIIDDLYGFNAAERSGDPFSDDPHGSHTAGSVAANGEVLGVAPEATLLPIRIFDEDDWTDAATIVRALHYAQEAGAQVTCNSYAGLFYNQAVRDAFANTDMLHVTAAGNYASNNDRKPHYPACYELDNMITVAASDRNDRLAQFSNYGAESVDLAAPGVEIFSTTAYGGHGSWSGTSMAAPHVAGAAALVAATFPEQSPEQWKERILESVDPQPGWSEKLLTGGRLNVHKAVTEH